MFGVACVISTVGGSAICRAAPAVPTPAAAPRKVYAEPKLPFDGDDVPQQFDDSLAGAIAEAYESNPSLAARRYDLRAVDDSLGIALSQLRAAVQLQVSAGYDLTIPGQITNAARPPSDLLNNPNIERNDLRSQLSIDQPLSTGGKASADIAAARADIVAGRNVLRGAEGDFLVDVITAYVDVRRDTQALKIRARNITVLKATIAEAEARREAGELTRTDIAQAQTQLQAAQVQYHADEAQLEASRAAFAALVGRPPRTPAPEPVLPLVPASFDEALDNAAATNPDIAAALASEQASRARIAAARAEGRATLAVRGTIGTTGPAVPFDRRDQDIAVTARATLSIPLNTGGRVTALVNQARNRNTADYLRVESARRQVFQVLVNAWNQYVSSSRNLEAQALQLRSARVFYEGTMEEYRQGLRSTFDVLFAQNTLRDTEIAILFNKRDRYVASAVLLRQTGQLDVSRIMTGTAVYEPSDYSRRALRRNALPWDGAIKAFDGVLAPGAAAQPLERPKPRSDVPGMAVPTPEPEDPELARVNARTGLRIETSRPQNRNNR